LFELLFGGWLAGAVLRHWLLSAADDVLSGQCCGADRCALPASAAVLVSTRPANMSLPSDWSAVGLAGLGDAF
jgi:hypothetical protein